MVEQSPHYEANFTAALWIWSGDAPASWHFLTLPLEVADGLKAANLGQSGRFGMVHVTATIGAVTWETKLFPDKRTGSFLLPVKAAIRKKAKVQAGDVVNVALALSS